MIKSLKALARVDYYKIYEALGSGSLTSSFIGPWLIKS